MDLLKKNDILDLGKWDAESRMTFSLSREDGEEHNIYDLENGDLEWEIIFPERPPSHIYQIPVDMKNLIACYQDEDVLRADGVDCAENVYGSYALYHPSKHGGKYGCGKAGHIYRPELIDANGQRAWCDIKFAGSNLKITMPTDFLNSATYPIILDPTIGYEVLGASNVTAGDRVSYLPITMPETGTLTIMHSGTASYEAPTVYHAIYTDNGSSLPGTLIEQETTGYTAADWPNGGWHQVNMGGTTTLTNGVTYWLAIVADSATEAGFRVRGDYAGGPAVSAQQASSTTFPATASAAAAYYYYSIYADYSVEGAATKQRISIVTID